MNLPLVSIIIPTYNRAKSLPIAIDSVIQQSYTNWECIIVDDGSSDNTEELMQNYIASDDRIYYCQRTRLPKGAATCRNIGLHKCSGDYVIFLDSDDYLLPFCLEMRVQSFQSSLSNNFLVFNMKEKKAEMLKVRKIKEAENHLDYFLSANLQWQTSSVFWRKEFIKSIGGFKEHYKRFNDPELTIRALLYGKNEYKVMYDSKPDFVQVLGDKNKIDFLNKINETLHYFIPEVCELLIKENKHQKIKLLGGYLHLWFRHLFIPYNSRMYFSSYNLISIFKTHNILNQKQALNIKFRLFLYFVTKQMGFTLDKLSSKHLYI